MIHAGRPDVAIPVEETRHRIERAVRAHREREAVMSALTERDGGGLRRRRAGSSPHPPTAARLAAGPLVNRASRTAGAKR